jgi:probable F420-dependent oxidoreductase
MRFAVTYNTAYYGTDPDRIIAFAQHAEDSGFESLYLPEHVVLYPGAMIGPSPLPPSLPYVDPLDCLSFVAAATQRILLGTGVLLLPYHHPVVLAKRLATIDVLSKGRMRLLTVGLGTLPGEAHAMGVDFSTRGRRADEAIDVMRLLWAGGEEGVSYTGEFFTLDNLVSYPKPYRTTHLPIHIGGSSRAAARRFGRRGDGYFPGGALTSAERVNQLDLARETAVEAGRSLEPLEYTRWGSIDMPPERIEELAAEGVTRVVITVPATEPRQQHDELSAFADRLALRTNLSGGSV